MLYKKVVLILLFSLAVFPSMIRAEENASGGMIVYESAIAADIVDFVPQGVSESFSVSVAKLYAYSKITGAKGNTNIKHLWYYGDRLMAEVPLSVKSASWRTYSSKNILPDWKGGWRVDITDEDGAVLDTLQFTIQ